MLHPTVVAQREGGELGPDFGGELVGEGGEGASGLTRSREEADPVRARAKAGPILFSYVHGGSAGLCFSSSVRVDGGDMRSCRQRQCGICFFFCIGVGAC
jgi:hypothetical protein